MLDKLTLLARACLVMGTLVFLGNAAVIWFDAWLVENNYWTVSYWSLYLSRLCGWAAFAVGFLGILPYSTLGGHLFYPTNGRAPIWWAVAGMLLAVAIGPFIGHLFFPQSGE